MLKLEYIDVPVRTIDSFKEKLKSNMEGIRIPAISQFEAMKPYLVEVLYKEVHGLLKDGEAMELQKQAVIAAQKI